MMRSVLMRWVALVGTVAAGVPSLAGAADIARLAGAATSPEDGQWVMPAKGYDSTRYSGLDQINTDSVSSLGVLFAFSTGVLRGHEAAPLVVGGTMYVVTPYPNIV